MFITVETKITFKLPQEHGTWKKWIEDNRGDLSKLRIQKTTTGITYINIDRFKVGEDGEA